MKKAELGPIRPPSESRSLLIGLSRNCPWNRCLFCPVYKNEKFSLRKKDELIKEIDYLSGIYKKIMSLLQDKNLSELSREIDKHFHINEYEDVRRLLHWIYHGEYTVFLQDADPLFRKKDELMEIIGRIKGAFPLIKRITAYGRASTLDRYTTEELKELKKVGLDRIHTGLESGSQKVLDLVCKGVRVEEIINAGKKLKSGGIEYSLYFMPGLGGRRFSNEHIEGTVYAINEACPDFVRLRTLGLTEDIPLYNLIEKGDFEVQSEEDIILEIKGLVENINVNTYLASDHNLNLLMDIEGRIPHDKEKMLKKIEKFLHLSPEERLSFIIARRKNLVFELYEFLSFLKSFKLEEDYKKISQLSEKERNILFLKMRAQNL